MYLANAITWPMLFSVVKINGIVCVYFLSLESDEVCLVIDFTVCFGIVRDPLDPLVGDPIRIIRIGDHTLI